MLTVSEIIEIRQHMNNAHLPMDYRVLFMDTESFKYYTNAEHYKECFRDKPIIKFLGFYIFESKCEFWHTAWFDKVESIRT